MNCKEIGRVGGQTVRCDLPEGHEGNHHARRAPDVLERMRKAGAI